MAQRRIRDHSIDCLKGIAAALVVLGHVIQYSRDGFESNAVYNVIYSFHMPLFMFLSGWVMTWVIKDGLDLKAFLKKRLVSLMLPFCVWAVIGSTYRSIGSFAHLSFKLFVQCLGSYIVTPEHGLWYCWVLFFICAIHAVIFKASGKRWGRGILLLTAFLLWLLPIPNYCGLYNMRRLFPYYIAGYYMNKGWNGKLDLGQHRLPGVGIGLLWLISIALVVIRGQNYILSESRIELNYGWLVLNQAIKLLIAFSWIMVFRILKGIIHDKLPRLSTVGMYSLDLYVLQVIPIIAIMKLKPLFAKGMLVDLLLCIIMTAFICAALYWVSTRIIRRNRFLALFLLGVTVKGTGP